MIKIAGGILLAFAIMGVFNHTVGYYDFLRHCKLDSYTNDYNWACEHGNWIRYRTDWYK